MNMIECVKHVSIQAVCVSLAKGSLMACLMATAVPNFKVLPIAVSVWQAAAAAAALTQSGQTSTTDGFGDWKFGGQPSRI